MLNLFALRPATTATKFLKILAFPYDGTETRTKKNIRNSLQAHRMSRETSYSRVQTLESESRRERLSVLDGAIPFLLPPPHL